MRSALVALGVMVIAVATLIGYFVWPRPLAVRPPAMVQATEITPAGIRIYQPQHALVGKLGEYSDGLFAYLMFDHYRSLPELKGFSVFLTNTSAQGPKPYKVLVHLPDDLIAGTTLLDTLQAEHWIQHGSYRWITYRQLWNDSERSSAFSDAYSDPASDTLEDLDPDQLQVCLARFIRFKSLTDYRIEHGLDPTLAPLTPEQADRLAGDIIAVSHFYGVPITLLVGIGAMENNYLSAPGDLTHTIWKRHAEPGDIVLKRFRHRVLVKDDSVGVWQITRKELRRAHELYLEDKRDYSELPERLIPPKQMDWDNIAPETLTTYAGLLLRQLLDHFHGDAVQAAGAYNGTLEHPNLRYAAGVELVAQYAQRVVGHAARLKAVPLPVIPASSAMPLVQDSVLQGAVRN